MGGTAEFRCGESEHRIDLTTRDIQLLDGKYFLRYPGSYRELFALDFAGGLHGAPPLNTVLRTHDQCRFWMGLQNLRATLEDQRDLVSYDYQYTFSSLDEPRDEGEYGGDGSFSGFRVNGFVGCIEVSPGRA